MNVLAKLFKNPLVFLFIAFGIGMNSGKAQITWNGATDSNWNTATNWTPNTVPTAADNVVIANVATAPIVANNVNTNSLTIDPGATLTINATRTLTSAGNVINNGTVTNNGIMNLGGTVTNNLTINNAGTITSTGAFSNAVGATLTVNAGGSFSASTTYTNAGTTNNSGTITSTGIFTNSGTFTANNGSTHNIASDFTQDGTYTSNVTSTVNFTGNSNITGLSAVAFNVMTITAGNVNYNATTANLAVSGNANINGGSFTLSSAKTISIGGNLVANANFTANSAGNTVTFGSATATISGTGGTVAISGTTWATTLNVNRDVTFSGGITIPATRTLNIANATTTTIANGNLVINGTLTPNASSTVVMSGTATAISGASTPYTFANLTSSVSGTLTPAGNLNIGANLSVTTGTFDASAVTTNFNLGSATSTISRTGGTLTLGVLDITGNPKTVTTSGDMTINTLNNIESGQTFTVSGGTATINGNITVDSGGNFNQTGGVITNNGDVTVAGAINCTAGTWNANGSGKVITGGGTSTFNILNVNANITISTTVNTIVNGALTVAASQTLTQTSSNLILNNNFVNNGTFVPNANTVTFAGGTGASISGSTAITFNNVVVNKTAGLTISTNNTTINGTFTLQNTNTGTVSLPAAITLDLKGNMVANGGSFSGAATSTVTMSGAAAASISGTTGGTISFGILSFDKTGSAAITIDRNITVTAGGLNVDTAPSNQNVTISTGVVATTTGNTLVAAGGTLAMNGTASLLVGDGNFTNNGTFTASSTSTVTINGTTANQTIGGTVSPTTFGNLVLNKDNRTLTQNNSVAVQTNFTITNGGYNIATTQTLTVQGNITIANNGTDCVLTGAASTTLAVTGGALDSDISTPAPVVEGINAVAPTNTTAGRCAGYVPTTNLRIDVPTVTFAKTSGRKVTLKTGSGLKIAGDFTLAASAGNNQIFNVEDAAAFIVTGNITINAAQTFSARDLPTAGNIGIVVMEDPATAADNAINDLSGTANFGSLIVNKNNRKITQSSNIRTNRTSVNRLGTFDLNARTLTVTHSIDNCGVFLAAATNSKIIFAEAGLDTRRTVGGNTGVIAGNEFEVFDFEMNRTAATNNVELITRNSDLVIGSLFTFTIGRIFSTPVLTGIGKAARSWVAFKPDAGWQGASDNSHVDGGVFKIGFKTTGVTTPAGTFALTDGKGNMNDNTSYLYGFIFPTGDRGFLGRIQTVDVTLPTAGDGFVAEYRAINFLNSNIADESGVGVSLIDVSDKEFWHLVFVGVDAANSTTFVRLFVEDEFRSGLGGTTGNSLQCSQFGCIRTGDVSVAKWDNGPTELAWSGLNTDTDYSGNNNLGSFGQDLGGANAWVPTREMQNKDFILSADIVGDPTFTASRLDIFNGLFTFGTSAVDNYDWNVVTWVGNDGFLGAGNPVTDTPDDAFDDDANIAGSKDWAKGSRYVDPFPADTSRSLFSWHNPHNWSPARVPRKYDNVIIVGDRVPCYIYGVGAGRFPASFNLTKGGTGLKPFDNHDPLNLTGPKTKDSWYNTGDAFCRTLFIPNSANVLGTGFTPLDSCNKLIIEDQRTLRVGINASAIVATDIADGGVLIQSNTTPPLAQRSYGTLVIRGRMTTQIDNGATSSPNVPRTAGYIDNDGFIDSDSLEVRAVDATTSSLVLFNNRANGVILNKGGRNPNDGVMQIRANISNLGTIQNMNNTASGAKNEVYIGLNNSNTASVRFPTTTIGAAIPTMIGDATILNDSTSATAVGKIINDRYFDASAVITNRGRITNSNNSTEPEFIVRGSGNPRVNNQNTGTIINRSIFEVIGTGAYLKTNATGASIATNGSLTNQNTAIILNNANATRFLVAGNVVNNNSAVITSSKPFFINNNLTNSNNTGIATITNNDIFEVGQVTTNTTQGAINNTNTMRLGNVRIGGTTNGILVLNNSGGTINNNNATTSVLSINETNAGVASGTIGGTFTTTNTGIITNANVVRLRGSLNQLTNTTASITNTKTWDMTISTGNFGAVLLNEGTITNSGTTSTFTGSTITLDDSNTSNPPIFNNDGTTNINASTTPANTGDLLVGQVAGNNTEDPRFNNTNVNAITNVAGVMTIRQNGIVTNTLGTMSIGSNVLINNNSNVNATLANSGLINIGGNFTNDRRLTSVLGTFGTLNFNRVGSATISGSGGSAFVSPYNTKDHTHNITINGTDKVGNTITFANNANFNILNNFVVPATVTVDFSSTRIQLLGNLQNDGTITASYSQPNTVTFANSNANALVVNQANTTVVINNNATFTGAGATTAGKFMNVVVDKNLAATTVDFNADSEIGGNFTNTLGTFTLKANKIMDMNTAATGVGNFTNNSTAAINNETGSEVRFRGSNDVNIAGTGQITFDRLLINKGGVNEEVTLTNNNAGEVTVKSNFTLTTGIVNTRKVNSAGDKGQPSVANTILVLNDDATVTGANNNSFVYGAMRKIGNDAIEFPVGRVIVSGTYVLTGLNAGSNTVTDINAWAPIGISAPSATNSTFTAEYFFTTPPNFSVVKESPIDHISDIEYWDLTATNNAVNITTTLHWKNGVRSNIGANGTMPDLLATHLVTTTLWENLGQGSTSAANTETGVGFITALKAINSFSPLTFASRSRLNPLPVTVIDFRANRIGDKKAKLQFSTSSEINIASFVLEKSNDNKTFEKLAELKPQQGTLPRFYSLVDENAFTPITYYRLKAVETDGRTYIVKDASVNFDVQTTANIEKVYPNPSTERFNVEVSVPANEPYTMVVTDVLGREVFANTATSNGLIDEGINLKNMADGVYILKLSYNGVSKNFRLVKRTN